MKILTERPPIGTRIAFHTTSKTTKERVLLTGTVIRHHRNHSMCIELDHESWPHWVIQREDHTTNLGFHLQRFYEAPPTQTIRELIETT